MFKMHGGPWGPWSESPFQRGDLKYVILDLLREESRHGYDIITVLKERSHGFYAPSPGAVYPTLQLLEEMGFVTSRQSDGKKTYTITDEGRRFLAERSRETESVKRHMRKSWRSEDAAEMRETMAEVGKLGRLIGQNFRSAGPDEMRRIREVVARARNDIEVILRRS